MLINKKERKAKRRLRNLANIMSSWCLGQHYWSRKAAMPSPKEHVGPFLWVSWQECMAWIAMRKLWVDLGWRPPENMLFKTVKDVSTRVHMRKIEGLSRLSWRGLTRGHSITSSPLLRVLELSTVHKADRTPPCIYTHVYMHTHILLHTCMYMYCHFKKTLLGHGGARL